MTNDELQAHIAAIRAECAAGNVELMPPGIGQWQECGTILGGYQYRMKAPPPLEVFIPVFQDGSMHRKAFNSPEECMGYVSGPMRDLVRAAKFREVLE